MSLLKTLLAIESATVEILDDDAIVKTDYAEDDESLELSVAVESLAGLFTNLLTLESMRSVEITTSTESLLLSHLVYATAYSQEDDTEKPKEVDTVKKALEPEESSNFLVRGLKAIWNAITKSVKWLFGKIADFFRWIFGIEKKIEEGVDQGLKKVDAVQTAKIDTPSESEVLISDRLSITDSPSKDLTTLKKNLGSLNVLSAWMSSHYSKVFNSFYLEIKRYAESSNNDDVKFLELAYEKALTNASFKPVFKHASTEGETNHLTTDPLVGNVVGEAAWSRGKLKSVRLETPVEKSDETPSVAFQIPDLNGIRELYNLATAHSKACGPLEKLQKDFKSKVDDLQKTFTKRLGYDVDGGEFKGKLSSKADQTKQELLLRAFHLLVSMASTPTMPLAKLHLGVSLRLKGLADQCISHFKED